MIMVNTKKCLEIALGPITRYNDAIQSFPFIGFWGRLAVMGGIMNGLPICMININWLRLLIMLKIIGEKQL
jgi:hypothetical protein